MSQVTTDPGQADALAAEYVLGTLDYGERGQAQALLASEAGFAAKVKMWERRLGELHLMVEPVEPDAKIWERIKAKVPQAPPAEAALPEPAAEPLSATPAAPSAEGAAATPPKSDEATPAEPKSVATPAEEAPSAPAETAAERSWAPRLMGRAPAPAAETSTPAAAAPEPAAVRVPAVVPQRTAATDHAAAVHRRVGRWRALAVLMLLMIAAVAGLLAAWKWAPDRVPPALQPVALMHLIGVPVTASPPPRRPAPPESQFDE